MSFSETKQAQKYASIAEVAAAQCKEYTDQARKAPEYTDQAKEYAESALDSKNSAAQSAGLAREYENGAAGNASSAQDSANSALTSEGNAEAYANAASSSAASASQSAQSAEESAGIASGAVSKTLRVSDVDLTPLPNKDQRAGKVITFDVGGNVSLATPASGSAADVLNELAEDSGSSLIGSPYGTLEEVATDVQNKISGAYSFAAGATLTSTKDFIYDQASNAYYYWTGTYGKVVPENSSPEDTGGIGSGAWSVVGDVVLRNSLASTSGASMIGVMPHGTLQDAMKWVTPEMFSGANDSEKLQAAVNYAAANKLKLVASGTYDITTPITVPDDLVIDASNGEFTFNAVDYIFHPLGADSFELHGGKYSASSYHTQRPQVVFNDYPDGLTNLPTRVVIRDTQCWNCGVGYVMVNCEDPTSIHIDVSGNYIKTDDNTDLYISNAGIPSGSGEVYPYLMVLGNAQQSVDVGTVRKSMPHITNNTFDVFMQSGPNADLIKIGGSTIGGNISGNLICNRNKECASEIDTFTGGLEMSISSNRLVNSGLKMQTRMFTGSTRVGVGGRSVISNNVFHFEENPLNDFAIFLSTSLVSISNNHFYYKGASIASEQRIFNFITSLILNNTDNGFGGSLCGGVNINGNTMQMVLDPAVDTTKRIQCINTTDMSGAIISGNCMFGGVGMVINARPEKNRNVWTGNYISSGLFTAEDVWRMNSAFVGSGNYIGSNYDNTVGGVPMLSKTLPSRSDGSKVRVTLDYQIKTGASTDRCLYLLYLKVSGGVKTNYATYIISSGVHDATDRSDATDLKLPIDQRLNAGTTSPSNLQSCFKAGYDGNGGVVIESMSTYSAANQPPNKVEYAIVPLTMMFPTL